MFTYYCSSDLACDSVARQSNNHLTLKMTVLQSTAPQTTTHPTMCHITQHLNPQQQRCENLTSLSLFLIFKSQVMTEPKPFRTGPIFMHYLWPSITSHIWTRNFEFFIISNCLICTGCLSYHEQALYLYRVSLLSWASTLFVQGVSLIMTKHFICTGCLSYHEQALYLYRVSPLTLSLLISYIHGAPSKARNLISYIYGRDFYWGFCFLNHVFH
jgi:hypothetical protein